MNDTVRMKRPRMMISPSASTKRRGLPLLKSSLSSEVLLWEEDGWCDLLRNVGGVASTELMLFIELKAVCNVVIDVVVDQLQYSTP
mmetsp:Transcript_27208/g.56216  ORF Transcript_27208/g.56216 Transcript_27208/m.56216 type:complete len:86 (-) Transcript_27208:28-285(-)